MLKYINSDIYSFTKLILPSYKLQSIGQYSFQVQNLLIKHISYET